MGANGHGVFPPRDWFLFASYFGAAIRSSIAGDHHTLKRPARFARLCLCYSTQNPQIATVSYANYYRFQLLVSVVDAFLGIVLYGLAKSPSSHARR